MSALAHAFSAAGFNAQQPIIGALQIRANTAQTTQQRPRLMLSIGVHGDETAPIEMVAILLHELLQNVAQNPHNLAVDLLIAVGNIQAIQAGKRFIQVDLNRLFVDASRRPDNFNQSQEAARADQLMQLARTFFEGATSQNKWHIDLHTAIRHSHYACFAIVPGEPTAPFLNWLEHAGIQAAVLNPEPSITFSSFTSQHCQAISCTAELGRIGVLGQNDLSQLAATQAALSALFKQGLPSNMPKNVTAKQADNAPILNDKYAPKSDQNITPMQTFKVAQEMIKHSDNFALTFDANTPNFTQFAPHTVIATDGERRYQVGDQPEYVLFPNPNVRNGLRAGLLVVKL